MTHELNAPFNAVEVNWTTPLDIAADGVATWDYIRIYRSGSENGTYTLQAQFPSQISGSWVTTWDDTTHSMSEKDDLYYLTRYYNFISQKESKFYLTWKTLSPKEQRLVNTVKCIITPWISQFCTDDDIRGGIILAMNAINMYPPTTNFTIDTFPATLEPLLTSGAAAFSLMFRYLGVAITDLSYSDMGFSLSIDRGTKVKEAITQLMNFAGFGGPGGNSGSNSLLALAKMEYVSMGASVGTLQLPISIGGNLNKGMLNVLDLFTSLGR